MRFAKVVFRIAGIWGLVILVPLYFVFDLIGRTDPPPITHPIFFYSFVGIALAWQIAFLVIAQDPARYRPMMIPSSIEKLAAGGAVIVLFLQGRVHSSDLIFGLGDLLLGALFVVAWSKLASVTPKRQSEALAL
jgi:hypothetical protein